VDEWLNERPRRQLTFGQSTARVTKQQKSKSKSKGNFLVATIVKVPPGARDSKQLKSSTI